MTKTNQATHQIGNPTVARDYHDNNYEKDLAQEDTELQKYANFLREEGLSNTQKLGAAAALRELLRCIWGPDANPHAALELDRTSTHQPTKNQKG